tara:strand:- start:142 stop:1611 length:1470 start_codon:yes stop_codon:yes gene_type:complete
MAITYHAGRRIQGLEPRGIDLTGLKSYWKFNEASGNLINTAATVGSTDAIATSDLVPAGTTGYGVTGVVTGVNGYSFNGADGTRAIASSSSASDYTFITNSGCIFTLCFWAKVDSTAAVYDLFGTSGSGSGDFQLRYRGSVEDAWAIFFSNEGEKLTTQTTGDTNYHFYMIQYDDAVGTLKFSIDNATPDEFTGLDVTSTGTPTAAWAFGDVGSLNEFAGDVTEFSMWNRLLTSAEITSLYNAGSGIEIESLEPDKPTNVQVGSRFEETDTRKMYHYTYDWFLEGTTIPPWSFTDDLSSSTPWTSVGSGITVTGGEISMAGVAASGSNYLWRSLSHTLSDTLWTMEFDYKSTGQSGGSVFFPFGVKSSVSPLAPNSGDSLRMRDDTDNALLGSWGSTVGGVEDGGTASIAWTEGSFYYPRVGRINSTTIKYQLFSDSARTSQVGSTLTATISSSITGLDTLVCGGGDGGGGTSTGKISNIYISESDLFT